MNLQKQVLIKLVERDRYPYPRYTLRLFPIAVKGEVANRQELFKFMLLSKDSFVRVFSNFQIAEREYDIIYLDIDDADLHMALMKLNVVLERLHEAGINNHIINFSGSKGFHVYVPFEPVRLYNYRQAIISWLTKVKIIDLVDQNALEPKRAMRLPSTVNTKSGFHCVSLGNQLNYNFEEIMQRAADNELTDFDLKNNQELDKILLTIDGHVAEDHAKNKRPNQQLTEGKSVLFNDVDYYPPCMRRLILLAMEGVDLNHMERMEMGIFLLHVFGGDVEKVAQYYSKMSDFNYTITSQQLSYFVETNQKMLTCQHMEENDICCEDRNVCPYNPSINKLMRKDNLLKIKRL